MEISGGFTMRISDLNLDFSKLEQNIGICPTKIIKKGQLIGKLKNIEAPYDIWSYERKITNEDVFAELTNLLNDLFPYFDYIREIRNVYEVTLNCYLRSDYAQMGLEITSDVITLIEKFGLGISFHILSFGGVEDE
ncbi:hypothetical protein Ga0466249_004944 [Sporomusaceae bacterium BoRhaA]|uniref:DUF4279 domain-containing protein n=1 Tax=Pelorhabdus rhamnosifermentans TaxID=2772457 RepID=UPI001C060E90|nr:DUF4279 domain-containing protein [Pelorhabdus rhamnosifermentans]MBU2703794.1 hypothetical protein [Pelorhabdus rhamnosifermentans]